MKKEELVVKEVNTVTAIASNLFVTTQQEAERAVTFLQEVARSKKRVTEFFSEQKKATYDAWQVVCKQETKILTPLLAAESVIKQRKTEYDLKVRREAEEQARLAEELAQKEEEKLRKRLDKQIAKTDDEDKKALLEEMKEGVMVHRAATPSVPKIQGASAQKDYTVEIVDLRAFLVALVSREVTIAYDQVVNIKTSAIKAYIKTTGRVNIPGCRIQETLIQRVKA